MHMMHGYSSFWWIIFMIVFWGGLITLGIFLIMNYLNGGRRKSSPLEIIKERLAKGEIDEKEYERLKVILEKDDNS